MRLKSRCESGRNDWAAPNAPRRIRIADALRAGRIVDRWQCEDLRLAVCEELRRVPEDGREFLEFAGKTHPKEKTHGSGCAFSAAITAGLANRLTLVDAIDQAKQLVNMAIQYGDGQGRGTTPVNVLAFTPKVSKK